MTSYIFYFLKILLTSFTLVITHITFTFLLPSPFSYINIIFIGLIILILTVEKEEVFWIAIASLFLIELYSITPFGIIIFSAVISIYLIFILYKRYFTNKTYYTIGVLTFLSLLFFRISFLLISFIIKVINNESFFIIKYLRSFSLELVSSTLTSIFLFLILQYFFEPLRATSIKKDWFQKT